MVKVSLLAHVSFYKGFIKDLSFPINKTIDFNIKTFIYRIISTMLSGTKRYNLTL